MPRQARFVLPHFPHHVIQRGHNRQAVFAGDDDYLYYLDTLKEWKGSLYSFFETRFGVRMLRAEEHIRAVAADRMAAETLGVKEGTPLLSVERVTYTYNDRPVEWRRGRYLTTQYHYHNELT